MTKSKGRLSADERSDIKYYIPLALSFLLLLVLNIAWGQNWIDSDMSAEMVFSDLLGDTGHYIASPEWYYSTEFRIAYTQLLFVPLLKLIGSWAAVRVITNVFFYAFLVLSFIFMMYGYERKHVLLASSVLLLPFSETIAQHMQLGNTYMPHMILMFLCVGLARRIDMGDHSRNVKLVWCLLLAVLSLICGASGVRYFMMIYAPLILCGIWRMYKVCGISEGGLARWRANSRLFWIAVASSAAALVGYVYNTVYIRSYYVFTTYESVSFVPINNGIWYERVSSVIGCLLEIFGYIPGGSVLSLRGVVTMAAFVMIFLMFYMVRRTYMDVSQGSGALGGTDAYTSEDLSDMFFVHFFASGFAVMTFFLAFTNTTLTPRYFSSCIYMALPVLVIWMMRENETAIRQLYLLALAACLALSVLKISYSLAVNDKNEARREVADYLVSNGYVRGYTLYDDSNVLVELSDGQLQVGALNGDLGGFFYWSTPQRFYEDDKIWPGDFVVLPEGTNINGHLGVTFVSTVCGYDIYVCK
ncbi:MAG: hypothetical protein K5871_05515 [Lachnospiraceae bacterium]|nr:hypothetical protein [Lachnospiraceae bacterium]